MKADILCEGAPECYRSDDFLARTKVEVQPGVDIWSLGGIYSEAATWVVLGMAGLTEYRNERQQEVIDKKTSQDGRPFHDGQTTLTIVEQQHDRLLEGREVRPGDYVTKSVLKEMVYSMLSDDPDGRDNAIVLWRRSQKILKKGRTQLEQSEQRQSFPTGEHIISNLQAFDQRTLERSRESPYKAAEQFNGPSNVHGPPPFDPRYSSNFRPHDLSISQQQPLKKRTDTWHDSNSTRVIEAGLHNMGFPSQSSPRQFPREGSTTLDNYTVHQGHINTRPTIAEETTDGQEGKMWQSTHRLESKLVPQHSTGESTPPESRTSPKSYIFQQIQNGAGLEPTHLHGIQESSPYGPPPNAQYSNPASIPKGPMLSQSVPDTAPSEENSSRSPPQASAFQPPASGSKSKRPSLSFAEAKKIREKRAVLPWQARQLLDKLKDRDHVRYHPTV